MSRSSLPEDTPATPGWVDAKIQAIFAPFGDAAISIRDTYAECLANIRGAVEVEIGQDRCRSVAVRALADVSGDPGTVDLALQALEAEIANAT